MIWKMDDSYKTCGSYRDFLDRGLLLSEVLLMVKLSLSRYTVATMTWLTVTLYQCQNDKYVHFVVTTSRSFPYSGL